MSANQQPNLRDKVKEVKEIADAIVHVSAAIKELQAGRLNEKALLTLISMSSKVPQKTIKKVMEGMASLEEVYLKPKQ